MTFLERKDLYVNLAIWLFAFLALVGLTVVGGMFLGPWWSLLAPYGFGFSLVIVARIILWIWPCENDDP